jgi:hypothetical protein
LANAPNDYKDVLNFDELISMEIYRHRDDDSLCYIETMDCHGNDYTLRPYEANQKQMQKVIKLSAGENGSKPTSDKMIVLHS